MYYFSYAENPNYQYQCSQFVSCAQQQSQNIIILTLSSTMWLLKTDIFGNSYFALGYIPLHKDISSWDDSSGLSLTGCLFVLIHFILFCIHRDPFVLLSIFYHLEIHFLNNQRVSDFLLKGHEDYFMYFLIYSDLF